MDAFSDQAASAIFAAFPGWRQYGREEQREDGTSYLVLQIDPPLEAAVDKVLLIHTDNDEVTVGFDFYHSHFGSAVGDGNRLGAAAAVEFVRHLVSERIAVASWWLDDDWRGSAQVAAGATPIASFVKEHNRIRVRSWKGRLNADITV